MTFPDADRIFGGAIVRYPALPTVERLVRFVDERVREAFGACDPEHAHRELAKDDLFDAIRRARDALADDPESGRLFAAVLEERGADVDAIFWDKLTLRVLPPDGALSRGPAAPVGVHRDTWSSRIYAQTNWWAPIRALAHDRTFALYPAYFTRPIANTSASWDPFAYLRAREAAPPNGDVPYPIVPLATEPVDRASEERVRIAPGELLAFSSAHLHASVRNTSDRTRVSVEVRTVSLVDLADGRAAPNVDGPTGDERWHWYRHLVSGRSLPDALTAP